MGHVCNWNFDRWSAAAAVVIVVVVVVASDLLLQRTNVIKNTFRNRQGN